MPSGAVSTGSVIIGSPTAEKDAEDGSGVATPFWCAER